MPESKEQVIQRELRPTENLLWLGSPRTGICLRRAEALLVPFSLLWGGFFIFGEVMAIRERNTFPIISCFPLALLGLYLMIGRFIVDVRRREKTIYAVTNKRVMIASGWLQRNIESLRLEKLRHITFTELSDLSGDIIFDTPALRSAFRLRGAAWPGVGIVFPPYFEMIENVRDVHNIILRAQEQNR